MRSCLRASRLLRTPLSTARRSRAGFSLIEALVALAVLAAVGGSATALFGLAGERDARATARLRAVLAAESLLARVGLDIPARTGRRRGRLDDGATWEILVAPPREPGLEGGETVLYAVTVRVAPIRGEPVVLESLTLDRGPF